MTTDNANGKLFVADLRASRVLQFGASGALITDVKEIGSGVKNSFNLTVIKSQQNVQISFRIVNSGTVSLKIYNTSGVQVADLLNATKEPGCYTIPWMVSNKKGLFLCQLKQGITSETKKIIIE